MAWSAKQIYDLLLGQGASAGEATYLTYASTHHEDPGGILGKVNNDPATGDYSVGLFQVNYFGDLLESRTKAYGSPQELAASPDRQAKAALSIYRSSGPGAWPTSYADLQAGRVTGPGGVPIPADTPTVLGGTNKSITSQPAGGHGGGGGGGSFWGGIEGAFGDAAGAVEGAAGSLIGDAEALIAGPVDFLKAMVWLINPLTWLRGVEALFGFVLILAGVAVALGADKAIKSGADKAIKSGGGPAALAEAGN